MKNTLILHRYLTGKKSPYIEKVSSNDHQNHVIIVLSERERNTKTLKSDLQHTTKTIYNNSMSMILGHLKAGVYFYAKKGAGT